MTVTITAATVPSHQAERVLYEKIGRTEWELREISVNVHDDVALWSANPRLQTTAMDAYSSEADLEAALRLTSGYDGLLKSIRDIGQMQSVYVQLTSTGKYLVLEGATRITILRELDRRFDKGVHEGVFRNARAKVLPPNFTDRDVAILLAGIHVRGSGVRDWGRYVEAKFIYETVVGSPGQAALMNQAELAQNMGKSESWVGRLKGAYEFALKFVEHADDDPNPKKLAAQKFSILEEISKARVIGPKLRDFGNKKFDNLREEVFDMVRNDVFKEYRDARFLKEFYEDDDAWAQLKSGELHVANRLARQTQDKSSSPKAKIAAVPQVISRALDRGDDGFDEDDVECLQQAISHIENKIHEGVPAYRVALNKVTKVLNRASRADVLNLEHHEISAYQDAHGYLMDLVERHCGEKGVKNEK